MNEGQGKGTVAARWQQFLLSEMPGAPSERSLDRTWVVLSLVIGGATLGSPWSLYGTALDVVNVIVGTVACLSLAARRTHPLAVALVTVSAIAVSTMAAAATILAVTNLALFRTLRTYAVVTGYLVATIVVNAALYPVHGEYLGGLPTRLLLAAGTIGLGLLARSQRQKLESQLQHRVDDARTAERTRIAREMHDVLAHRLSLLAVQAGALEFHPDAEPSEVAHAAGVIRASAHAALGELRQVIGLLRDPLDDGGATGVTEAERPQPALKDLPRLVEESREAGMDVAFELRLDHPEAVPDGTARAVYRVVQEGLTNARKHAPASSVEVEVARDGDSGLTVSVLNRPPGNGAAPRAAATASGC
jgi:signal transduction histidine kinase